MDLLPREEAQKWLVRIQENLTAELDHLLSRSLTRSHWERHGLDFIAIGFDNLKRALDADDSRIIAARRQEQAMQQRERDRHSVQAEGALQAAPSGQAPLEGGGGPPPGGEDGRARQ